MRLNQKMNLRKANDLLVVKKEDSLGRRFKLYSDLTHTLTLVFILFHT